jgi:hypothetical protein
MPYERRSQRIHSWSLIAIARKMLTAWKKLKEKAARAESGSGKKKPAWPLL